MRYCRRRGNVNLDGVATSKRPLFWMIVAAAAACSVLPERVAFATALGRFTRTLLQHNVGFTLSNPPHPPAKISDFFAIFFGCLKCLTSDSIF